MKKTLILIAISFLALFSCKKEKLFTYQDQLALDIIKINKYLNNKGIKDEYQVSATSLYYKITDEGNADGIKPGPTDSVTVKYKGYFLDGRVFDETTGTDVAEFTLTGVISGFAEGLQLLNKKGKATIILPSGLAYGRFGSGSIDPNTPIIFDIELVDFK
jgi:FKBP-type peptidyl-prolyl cis-trans isomerase FkpA